MLKVTLSLNGDLLDKDQIGYQAPLAEDEVEPFDEEFKREFSQ